MPPAAAPVNDLSRVPVLEPVARAFRPDRLELQSAIIYHLEWCVLFNEHLALDPTQATHAKPLPDANACELGQWLHRVLDRREPCDPRLLQLSDEHDRFHILAQQALSLAQQHRMDLASTLLNTDFERSRARMLDLLRSMQKD